MKAGMTLMALAISSTAFAVGDLYKWTGAVNGNWTTDDVANWTLDGTSCKWINWSEALIDDSATTKTIVTPEWGGENPSATLLVVSNESSAIVFQSSRKTQDTYTGSGGRMTVGLKGANRFEKRGKGKLTLKNYSSFTGDVVVVDGELTTDGTPKGDVTNACTSPIGDWRTARTISVLTNATLSLVSQGITGAGTSTKPIKAVLESHGGTINFSQNFTAVLGNCWFEDATLNYTGGANDTWRTFCFYGDYVKFSGTKAFTLYSPSVSYPGFLIGRFSQTKIIVDDMTGNGNDDLVCSLPVRAITGRTDGNNAPGTFEKRGAGTMALNTYWSTFCGDVKVSEGTLRMAQGRAVIGEAASCYGNLTVAHTVTVCDGATLLVDGNDMQGQYYNNSKLTIHVNGGTLKHKASTSNGCGPMIFENAKLDYCSCPGYTHYETVEGKDVVRSGFWPTFGFHGGVTFKGTNAYHLARTYSSQYDTVGSRIGCGANGMSDICVEEITGDGKVDVNIAMPIVDGPQWSKTESRNGKAYIIAVNHVAVPASFRKTGAGTLALSDRNDYTGATSVHEGKLLVNGSVTQSAITVDAGTYIGGTGSVNAVTLADGAGLTASVGQKTRLRAQTVTFSGGTLRIDIARTAGDPDLSAVSSIRIAEVENIAGTPPTNVVVTYGGQPASGEFSVRVTDHAIDLVKGLFVIVR